jgi:O-antigen/teichoic acid export membrane protein
LKVAVARRGRRIVSQVGLSAVTNIVIALSKLAVLPLLAYALSPAEFGAYSLITAAAAFGLLSLGLGAHSYTYRAVPGLDGPTGRRIMSTTALFEVVLAGTLLLGAMVTGIGEQLLGVLQAGAYKHAFALGVAWVLVELVVLNMRSYLYAAQLIGHANVIDILRQVGWMPVAATYWLFSRTLTLDAVVVAMVVGSGAAVVYGMFWARPFIRVGVDPGVLSKALPFAVPLIIPAATLSIMRLGERSIMSASRSLEDLAAYSLVAAFASGLYSCTALAIETVLMPRAVLAANRGEANDARSILWTSLKFSAWAFALTAIAAWLVLPQVVGLLGPHYAAGFAFFPVIALSYLVMIGSRTPHNALVLANRTRSILAIDALSLVVAIGLDLLLIPPLGIFGVAVASIASFAFSGAAKALAVDLLRAVPWRELITPSANRVVMPEFILTPPEGPN